MAKRKIALGRGLEGLIAGASRPPEEPPSTPAKKTASAGKTAPARKAAPASPAAKAQVEESNLTEGYREVPIGEIDPSPYQARRDIPAEAIEELAESIRSEGLLQPIVVRLAGKRYQLIAGERRWRACQFLNMRRIPARVMEVSDASAAVLSLIENLQRENLNPIDEALGLASLLRDFDLTQEGLAERLGKPRATLANAVRLLSLEREIQGYVAQRRLSVGHAKVLMALEETEQRLLLARRIVERGHSVREAERLVQSMKSGRATKGTARHLSASEATAVADLEKRLSSNLATKVKVRHSAKKGRIVIEYFGEEDLQRLLEKMGMTVG